MRTLLLAVVVASAFAADGGTPPAAKAEPAPMRWRTCVDRAAGVAFRYPYELYPQDQLEPVLYGASEVVVKVTGVGAGAKLEVVKPVEVRPLVRLVAKALTDLPEDVRADRAKAATHCTGLAVAWNPRGYAGDARKRPFAAGKGAAQGVAGLTGGDDAHTALVWFHQDRVSALVVAKEVGADGAGILDSFEVLPPASGRKPAQTWREQTTAKGRALGGDGNPAFGNQQVPWEQGWEIETEHYHVTGHTSVDRLLEHGRNLEALYDTYAALFEPERISPFKFEVHIFHRFADLQEVSAALGNPIAVRPGEMLGGFFMPKLQSLWVYEESGRLGGPSMTVEHVMAHECSHQFLHMACNGSDHVPTWLNEGIAVHFESGKLKNGQYVHATPSDRIQRLKELYRQRKTTIMPLEQYLDHHAGISAASYGEVYAMMHFWVFGAPGGKKRFHEYWQAMKAGEDGAKAFERVFMADMIKAQGSRAAALRAWQEQLIRYVNVTLK